MPSVYNIDAFQARVNYAAQCLVAGGSRTGTRHFDTCFEMYDGDIVVTALCRRALANEKLRGAIARSTGAAGFARWTETAHKYEDVPTRGLPAVAKRIRDEAQAAFAKWLQENDAKARGQS